MPGKRKGTMDIREILRRVRLDQSDRAIADALSIDRKTIGRYRRWATEQGFLEGPLPPLGELHRSLDETLPSPPAPQNISSVEPYRNVVAKLRRQGVEIAAIHQRLQERGYTGSYSSVRRFVRQVEPSSPQVTVRVETPPGEEAQVDFGYAGRMTDPDTGRLRKAWAFVMLLSWSGCVVRAFKFPGGHVMAPPETMDEAIAWLVEERGKLEEQARKRTRRR